MWLDWPKFSTDLGYRKLSRDDITHFATNFYLLAANLAMNLSYVAHTSHAAHAAHACLPILAKHARTECDVICRSTGSCNRA